MKSRLASFALVLAVLGSWIVAPIGASAQDATGVNSGTLKVDKSTVFDGNKKAGTFTGTVSDLTFDTKSGKLLVSGVLDGTVSKDSGGKEQIKNLKFDKIVSTANATNSCKILTLDIGRIKLDVLGLVVDIAPIDIDVSAVPGPGNLLGNLLCALVGLLD